jgi:dipeptidyl aminopeptidase/acylaminoacyl peptidase
LARHSFDVWAKAALQRGYAVLVVDPLTPRSVVAPGENCRPPTKVREVRLRKDAFDAAEHLRKQPFVDPERIGLLGMSQGALPRCAVFRKDGGRARASDTATDHSTDL